MTDAPFELREFEHVEAIPGKALLRIAADPTFDPAATVLVVDGEERIAPLPAPPGPPGVARVAFSIPADLAERARGYALALGSGALVDLPAPSRRQGTRTVPAGAGLSGPAPAPAPPRDDGGADVIAELQRRLEAERALRVSADTAAQTSAAARSVSETRLRSLGAELADARADLDTTRGDLETTRERLRTAQGEAELGQTQASHARAEAEAAESTLIQRAAEIALLRQTLTDRDAHAQTTYEQWEHITAELSAEVEVARQVAANFQDHARRLQLELADSRLELTSLRALGEAHAAAVAAGSATDGDAGDPAVVSATLNAAAAALEQARSRAAEAEAALARRETELERLRAQLPAAS
ncbi:MAG TPA: hypothetical protein VFN48_09540 [Solirubrobacteraceae bacterium]|nr:hypothetical protein [Solirubrobacteraceae bacterium]